MPNEDAAAATSDEDDEWIEEDDSDVSEDEPTPKKKPSSKHGKGFLSVPVLSKGSDVGAKTSSASPSKKKNVFKLGKKKLAAEAKDPGSENVTYALESKTAGSPSALPPNIKIIKTPDSPITAVEMKAEISDIVNLATTKKFEDAVTKTQTLLGRIFVAQNEKKPKYPTTIWYTQEQVVDNTVTLACFNFMPSLRQLFTATFTALTECPNFKSSDAAIKWNAAVPPSDTNTNFTAFERLLVKETTLLYPSAIKAFVLKAKNNGEPSTAISIAKTAFPVELDKGKKRKATTEGAEEVEPKKPKGADIACSAHLPEPHALVSNGTPVFKELAELCSTHGMRITMNVEIGTF